MVKKDYLYTLSPKFLFFDLLILRKMINLLAYSTGYGIKKRLNHLYFDFNNSKLTKLMAMG